MQDSPDAKKPCKGILKNSSSFDKPAASYRKSAKFDELNVLQTFHPKDKDYGHIKIDEPKTPYNYAVRADEVDQLDANLLAEKLRIAANTQSPSFGTEDFSDEEFAETDIEKVHRMEFERRRKAHYKEFEAVKLARKLIQEELGDDDDDEVSLSQYGTSKLETESASDFPSEEGEKDLSASLESESSGTRPAKCMEVDSNNQCTPRPC